MNPQINYQIPSNKFNSFMATPIINNQIKNNDVISNHSINNIFLEHKWIFAQAIFYSLLFYFLTSPNVIEMTSNYIPQFIGKRIGHSIIFGILFLLLNWKK